MIAVCGEALIDMVRNGARTTHPGGGPFNTARALARLGVPAAFVGRLSNDAFGIELAGCLTSDGVDLSMASVGPEPTTVAVAEIDESGVPAYHFLVEGTSAPNLTPAMLPQHLPSEVRVLHVGSLGLLLEPMASTIAQLVEGEGGSRPVMVDPNIRTALVSDEVGYRHRLEAVLAQSTIVKANESDIAWLFPATSYEDAAASILRSTGVRIVVVTLGAGGAFGATPDMNVHVAAPRVAVVDTIGAGDAFGAALLAWLHDHKLLVRDLALRASEMKDALAFACLVASTTCTRAGADTPRRSEISSAAERLNS
jgi:fructokinase